MDFDNDITKLDLPADTAFTTVQNIWVAIQEIQLRMRFQEVDLTGSPALPPVDKVDICLRAADNKLVAVKNDGSIVDIENSPAVSDHGTKIKSNGTLVSSSARPLNLPTGSPLSVSEDSFNDYFTVNFVNNGIVDAMIASHTSTKITITNLAQLPSSLITETNTKTMTNKTLTAPIVTALDFGASFITTTNIRIKEESSTILAIKNTADNAYLSLKLLNLTAETQALMKAVAEPSSPAAGYVSVYVDTADGHVKRKSSAGAVVDLEATGGTITDIPQNIQFSGDISPAQITSNQNDYNPTGLSTASRLRLNTDASRNITGLAGGADGRLIKIYNIGSFDIVLKNEDAGSTATNRFTLGGADLTLTANKVAILSYDSTLTRWILESTSVIPTSSGGTEFDYIEQARNRFGFIEDFLDVGTSTNFAPLLNGTGTAFVNVDTIDLATFGVGQLSTGTTTTGEASIYFSSGTITHQTVRLGQGITTLEGRIRLPTLSTVAQEYRFIFGITDTPDAASQNEGVWLEYERANSVNWRRSTGNDGTKTENASSTAVVAATWIRLKIVVNAAASSVEYFVNGTSIGTETTNIPSAAGDELFVMIGIFKSAGTTASLAEIDYAAFQVDLTTPR